MAAPLLIVLVGPTAIGKTKWAIDIALHYNTEILSADARQFYKEMEIGTAVPTAEEMRGVRHHFIQHISIHDPYSVGDWVDDATSLIRTLFETHNILVLTGGSSLYINALLYGLDDFPQVDPQIRTALNDRLRSEGIEILQQELKSLDPVYFAQVDRDNPHRLIRALEICKGSGQPYSSFLGKKRARHDFDYLIIGLHTDREKLYDRINARVDGMMKEGLLEEAKVLYPSRNLNALQTVGYREIFSHFDGDSTLEEAVASIKTNTRRYAKRQMTWLRKMEEIHWFDSQTPVREVLEFIESKKVDI